MPTATTRQCASRASRTARLELDALRFDLALRRAGGQTLEPDLVRAQHVISAARHVAWFFPTWWSSPPALVKGFVDRVFLPGYAYRYQAGRALHHKLLRGRSARLVTTMDAPWWWYTLVYWRALHRSFVRGTLRFVGFAPVWTTTWYGLRSSTAPQRARMLERMSQLGARDAATLRRQPHRTRDERGMAEAQGRSHVARHVPPPPA